MQRIIKIEKYRNIGLEKPETLVLNHSMAKGELGDLIILIGANNSGKSNVLDALRAIGQGKLRDRDITTLSFSSEDRVPSVSFSVRDKDYYMYYNVGLNKQADVQIKLEDKKESPSVLDRQMLIDDMEAALNFLSPYGIGDRSLRDLLAKVRLEETEITDALVDEAVQRINAAEATFRSNYGRSNNFVNSMPADGYWRINHMVTSRSELDRANDYCQKWKKEENIDYSVYGTPLESTTYKFAKCLQKRFGQIPEVTDRNYITNSYHVHVTEEIDAFTKLKFESEFQELSPGGAISYVEVPNMSNNIDAVLAVIEYIYDNIMYAELNTKSDYCQKCGYDGEIADMTERS